MAAAGRSSMRLDTFADARRSLSPIKVIEVILAVKAGELGSIVASSVAKAAALLASSVCLAAPSGIAPAACSCLTITTGAGGARGSSGLAPV